MHNDNYTERKDGSSNARVRIAILVDLQWVLPKPQILADQSLDRLLRHPRHRSALFSRHLMETRVREGAAHKFFWRWTQLLILRRTVIAL